MSHNNLYKKKPVVVEARQFTGGEENATALIEWMLANNTSSSYYKACTMYYEHIAIRTLETTMQVYLGWWIIKEIPKVKETQGVFYICDPDIFEDTYHKTVQLCKMINTSTD